MRDRSVKSESSSWSGRICQCFLGSCSVCTDQLILIVRERIRFGEFRVRGKRDRPQSVTVRHHPHYQYHQETFFSLALALLPTCTVHTHMAMAGCLDRKTCRGSNAPNLLAILTTYPPEPSVEATVYRSRFPVQRALLTLQTDLKVGPIGMGRPNLHQRARPSRLR